MFKWNEHTPENMGLREAIGYLGVTYCRYLSNNFHLVAVAKADQWHANHLQSVEALKRLLEVGEAKLTTELDKVIPGYEGGMGQLPCWYTDHQIKMAKIANLPPGI